MERVNSVEQETPKEELELVLEALVAKLADWASVKEVLEQALAEPEQSKEVPGKELAASAQAKEPRAFSPITVKTRISLGNA